jgi:hypothetical protein
VSPARTAQNATAIAVEVGFISELRSGATRQRRDRRARPPVLGPAGTGRGCGDQAALAVGSMELSVIALRSPSRHPGWLPPLGSGLLALGSPSLF